MSGSISAVEAFARALQIGGVSFVTAFPGSPTTVLAQFLEREGERFGIEFRWAINENVALSQAFGAAMAGRGAAALMKHVGVNVAADALHAMGVVHGLAGPLLLIEGADAKPGSSQSAQDNRSLYAGSPRLVVLTPTTPAQIHDWVIGACTMSTRAGMLVVVRGDARCFSGRGPAPDESSSAADSPFTPWPERGRALACSARTYAWHLDNRALVLAAVDPWLAELHARWGGPAPLGVVVAGHLGESTAEAVRDAGLPGVSLGCEHPLTSAEPSIVALAREVERLLVLEECDDLLQRDVAAMLHRAGVDTPVLGRRDVGDPRPIGRVEGRRLAAILAAAQAGAPGISVEARPRPDLARLVAATAPIAAEFDRREADLDRERPPKGFGPRDPRPRLFAALRALRPTVFVTTDPGVTGLLALADHGSDVKMHMGGAVPIAAGWSRARGSSDHLAVAVVGDTNLPHSEWLGLLDAIDHGDDLLVVIADNGSSEMTQHIVTPRLRPEAARASLEAAGLPCATATLTAEGDADQRWIEVLGELADDRGPRLLWLEL